MYVDELPAAFEARRIDALVCDQLEAAGGLVARGMGLAYASIANALPINREPTVPPFYTGWGSSPSAWEQRRNKGAEDVSDWMMRRHGEVVSRAAHRWKLGPLATCVDCLSPVLDIIQTVPGFDFPRAAPSPAMT